MLKFPARNKNYRNYYTAHTIVPVDRGDNSCVWNDNSVLQKSGIVFFDRITMWTNLTLTILLHMQSNILLLLFLW